MKLVGPIFFTDVRVSSRRARQFVIRMFLALSLFALMMLALWGLQNKLHSSIFNSTNTGFMIAMQQPGRWGGGPPKVMSIDEVKQNEFTLKRQMLQEFTESFSFTILGAMFVAVVLLTPITVVGAISEERNRRTLEFLFATELSDQEIIVGKFLSRTAQLMMLIVVPLPMLLLLEFFGGIPSELIAYGFGYTISMIFSLGGITLYLSCGTPNWQKVLIGVYILCLGWMALPLFMMFLLQWPVHHPVISILSVGNPVLSFEFLRHEYGRSDFRRSFWRITLRHGFPHATGFALSSGEHPYFAKRVYDGLSLHDA